MLAHIMDPGDWYAAFNQIETDRHAAPTVEGIDFPKLGATPLRESVGYRYGEPRDSRRRIWLSVLRMNPDIAISTRRTAA